MNTTPETVSHAENSTHDSSIFERAPWYVVFCRFVTVLFFTVVAYAFLAGVVALCVSLFVPIATILAWAESHMAATITILVVSYILFTIWLMGQAAMAVCRAS